jgi:hypothetical protein
MILNAGPAEAMHSERKTSFYTQWRADGKMSFTSIVSALEIRSDREDTVQDTVKSSQK